MGYTQCQASRLAFLFLAEANGVCPIAFASKPAQTLD
jgi:hypothetical protein